MIIHGKQLLSPRYEQATNLEVWRLDEGVAIGLSDKLLTCCYAGCHITWDEWQQIVRYIENQFKERMNGG